eukprot:m.252668 g.252668  ORF g.252668 m.252668 type:complete len:149 (+) comp54527_c0_seq8:421-867(+)
MLDAAYIGSTDCIRALLEFGAISTIKSKVRLFKHTLGLVRLYNVNGGFASSLIARLGIAFGFRFPSLRLCIGRSFLGAISSAAKALPRLRLRCIFWKERQRETLQASAIILKSLLCWTSTSGFWRSLAHAPSLLCASQHKPGHSNHPT